MKINFPILDESIQFDDYLFLVIENKNLFCNVSQMIVEYDETIEFRFYHDNFTSLAATELMTVTDILSFDINNSAVIKYIYSDLIDQLNENPEKKSEFEKLMNELKDLVEGELFDNELNLVQSEMSLAGLFKALDVRVDLRGLTLFDRMFEILKLFSYFGRKKILIFINVCSYFDLEQIKSILEYIQLAKISVLFVEPNRLNDIRQTVIDDDFYVIMDM